MISEARNAKYALYQGKEYLVGKNPLNGRVVLMSRDPKDKQNGFFEFPKGKFKKEVAVNELEIAYSVFTFAQYNDFKFQLGEIKDGKGLLVFSGNDTPIRHLDFEFVEPHVYEKWVPLEELESIFEEKTPIWGFTLPNN